MRTITIKLYSINELQREVRDNVLGDYCDINVEGDDGRNWHDEIRGEARRVGLWIKDYLLTQPNYIELRFNGGYANTAELIMMGYDKNTPIYKAAEHFIKLAKPKLVFIALLGENIYNAEKNEAELFVEHHVEIFRKKLEKIFWAKLDELYSYLTSPDAIAETLMNNGYEFTAEGVNLTTAIKKMKYEQTYGSEYL